MERPTIYFNNIPLFYSELLDVNTIAILYKHEGKTPEQIKEMKKNRRYEDIDKIIYNFGDVDNTELFNLVGNKIT